MTSPSTATFLATLITFTTEFTNTYALKIKANPEDQLKAPVTRVVEGANTTLGGKKLQVLTEVQVSEISGRPDLGVVLDSLLAGYIELKAPGKGARPERLKGEDKVQWEKFKNLPNLIYTA